MEGGWSKAASARAFHTTPKAVAKWVARFRAEGLAGLQDHSRPRSVPNQAALALCARVEVFHRQRHAGEQIAAEIGVSAATVTRIIKRLRLNQLSALEPARADPSLRTRRPGEIIHIDIKKLGKFNRNGHPCHRRASSRLALPRTARPRSGKEQDRRKTLRPRREGAQQSPGGRF